MHSPNSRPLPAAGENKRDARKQEGRRAARGDTIPRTLSKPVHLQRQKKTMKREGVTTGDEDWKYEMEAAAHTQRGRRMRKGGRQRPTQHKRARRVTTCTGVHTELAAETKRMRTCTQHQRKNKGTHTHTYMHIRRDVYGAHANGHLRIRIPRAPWRQAPSRKGRKQMPYEKAKHQSSQKHTRVQSKGDAHRY